MKMTMVCVTSKKTGAATNVGVDVRDKAFLAKCIIDATHRQ